jgi:2-dehydro-3-deoxyphosphogluconate aldolase/(4S)-4-hydroxy-2-oxoglutarate aldolase
MGGLSFLKAIRGPMPFVRFMLSGGVNLNNISEYLSAKASCILIGSSILKKEFVDEKNWDAISDLAKKFTEKIENYLSPKRNPSEKV